MSDIDDTYCDSKQLFHNTEADQAEIILQSFNTWKFKREKIVNTKYLQQNISQAVVSQKPLSFVMYWGKGKRDHVAQYEEMAVSFLQEMITSIRECYRFGVHIDIIYADTHAILNGHSKDSINTYLEALLSLFISRYFCVHRLSNFAEFDENILVKQKQHMRISKKFLDILMSSARKHCGRYGAITGAKLYYLQNQIEKKSIQKHFPHSIFLTYNGSEMDDLFPDLPKFYMYSIKKGVSVKPWFL